MARGDLTDEEWSLIEPHLPLGERGPTPDLRQQFNAAMWRFRTGSPWRDLPAEYGPCSTVCDRFRSWAMMGVFEQAMIAEAAARGQVDLGLVSVDSTTARAHHHAAGMVLGGELAQAPAEGRRARPLAGRADQLGAPVRRAAMPSAVLRAGPGPGGRQPAVSCRAERHQGPPARRSPAHPPGCGGRRQGVLLSRQPRLPAPTRHQGSHPRESRPGSQPQEARRSWRPTGQS